MNLSIKYLGVSVVNVNVTNIDSTLFVNARATFIASIAANMNNNYISHYSGAYLPTVYIKKIDQGDYFEDRTTTYDRQKLEAQRISKLGPEQNCLYPIMPESRDFFSALFYLRTVLDEPRGELWVDANKLIWKVNYKIVGYETISTKLGRKQAIKLEITFNNYSKGVKERSDMLTNNLVDEDKVLEIWFSNDDLKLPIKAKFIMAPFPVTWKLNSYTR
ncbi:MAG: DUF3108 domain-containing protein [Candidatus Cloacimonetes bacterium]|nr:DUF3108 domain-containing protein [Candidatus Cloacimonadota bacterium]